MAACFLTRLERSRLKFADRAGRSPDKRWLWAFLSLRQASLHILKVRP